MGRKLVSADLFYRILTFVLLGAIFAGCGRFDAVDSSEKRVSEVTSFRFTLTGDPRSDLGKWRHTLKQAKANVNNEFAFHITAGDFFENDRSTVTADFYNVLKEEFGNDVVWYPGMGNHEFNSKGTELQWFREYYQDNLRTKVTPGPKGCEETTYSWDYENAHFVQLNMYWDGEEYGKGGFSEAIMKWLEDDLEKNTKPVVFVIYHRPAWPNGRGGKNSPKNWERFLKLLNDKKVVAGLCADTHTYGRYQVDGDWEKYTWEVDAGNAGRISHGNKLQTFVDITVTSDDRVIFETWQGLEDEPFRKTDSWISSVDVQNASEKAAVVK
ncbi:MAG: metallophosphoesterase family protein [Planctomycetota bacterium]|jgi:hypothetical protein